MKPAARAVIIVLAIVVAAGAAQSQGQVCGTPQMGCRTSLKASLRIKDNTDNNKDRLLWKSLKGQATTLADFGLPTGTTAFTLCIYAGTSALEYTVPGGANWTAIGEAHSFLRKERFRYKDMTGAFDGIQMVVLRSGFDGQAKALVRGKGNNLPDPTLPFTLPVTAQLVNSSNNICYTTSFAMAKKNTSTIFRAKSP